MSLEIIKNDAKELTKGEQKVLNKIKILYKETKYVAYLYVQPTIGQLIPDFILIDPKKGLCILEVKDWELSYIQEINKKSVVLQDRQDDNPIHKTSKYLNIAKGLIACSKEDVSFVEEYIFARTAMVNLTNQDVEIPKMKVALNQPPVKYFTWEELRNLSIDQLYNKEEIDLNKENMIKLRTLLFPESKIIHNVKEEPEQIGRDKITILDIEQENFAKKVPYGHYMVTGVPGSGKTIILIARALHIIKEHPDWNVGILAYNRSLANKIEEKLTIIAQDYAENDFLKDIAIQNIQVKTFHSMARQVANISIPKPAETPKNFWDEVLPEAALKVARPLYDAILIDEYQDFRDCWIKLCIALCRKHSYKTSSGKDLKGINLFMAGDRLQSIYNNKEHNWNDFGIDMRGRSKLLKTSYRAGKRSVELALKFLMSYPELEKEVKRFYKEEEDEQVDIRNIDRTNEVIRVEGSYNQIAKQLTYLLVNKKYEKEDILILYHNKNECRELKYAMPEELREYMYEIRSGERCDGIAMTTYHSAKGLESKVVILVNVDKFACYIGGKEQVITRKLLYVGMTRASEVLMLHASTPKTKSYYSEIKSLLQD